ncbi:conjugal transfer protein TraO [Pseudomonas fluorescens]|uniref:KfrB domain-containing protein n=1 Tax=Pseudomonas TaxID=286 RepID=UPI000F03364C|nr:MULTISPECIES: conjugal transfer protein TraO [Pseudomonas]MBD8088819.1 conjugal transfer protein TraO [Pseudomonas fluorescens]MBD8614716.1 conjugal transfer protein TraO [Pseudomonas putida]MBD8681600.1 conjugal transfer protein TraO [Pseudomonas sp. CFBP 13719]
MAGYFPPVLMKPEGSLKLCHMNGSIQIDKVVENQWLTVRLLPTNAGIPTGIHQLADAKPASGGMGHQVFSQNILYADNRHVYQFSDNGIVKHDRSLFKGEPKLGVAYTVEYENGRGIAIDVAAQEKGDKPAIDKPRHEHGSSLSR